MIRYIIRSIFPALIVGGVFALLLSLAGSLTAYLVMLSIATGLLVLVHAFLSPLEPSPQIRRDRALLGMLLGGSWVYLLFIESAQIRIWFALVTSLAVGVLFSFIFLSNLPPYIVEKPFRRIRMLLWVWTTFLLAASGFALDAFFQYLPEIITVLLLGGTIGFATYHVFRLYVDCTVRQAGVWLLVFFLAFAQLAWVFLFLPFDYVASGFIFIWIWYVFQLFVRFFLTPRGVEWEKHRMFLFLNIAMLLFLLVFYVRWV